MTSPASYFRRGSSRDWMLRTKVTEAPKALPITVEQVKGNLLIEGSSQDDYIASLIAAATDKAQRVLGRKFVDQEITGYLDYVGGAPIFEGTRVGPRNLNTFGEVQLLYVPFASVTSVTIYDEGDNAIVVDPSTYRAMAVDDDLPGRLTLKSTATWPGVPGGIRDVNGFEVVYRVGYGEDPCAIPAEITHGLIMLTSYLYNNRGDCGCSDEECVAKCGGFAGLLGRRVVRI